MHIITVDDNLDDTVPYLFADIIASYADEVEYGVDVPGVIDGILLGQDGYLEHLKEKCIASSTAISPLCKYGAKNKTKAAHCSYSVSFTHHLFPDGVVGCLKVAEHLGYDLLGIAAITHGVQQICSPLSNTNIPLSLRKEQRWGGDGRTRVEKRMQAAL